MAINIKSSDRVTFIGATGYGKTVLAKYLLAMCNRVFCIDPKHTLRIDGFKLNKGFTYPTFSSTFQYVLRPGRSDDGRLSDLLWKAFKKKNVTLYCDELAVIEERYPDTLSVMKEIALTGREKHVSLWNALQRPRNVPRIFFTEAEVFFQFNLRSEDDRDYMAGYLGSEVKEQIEKYNFWYYHAGDHAPRVMRLDLKSQKIIMPERSVINA